MNDKQKNNEEFLCLFKEGLASTNPNRVFEIGQELRRLNQEYFPVSEPLEVKVLAS